MKDGPTTEEVIASIERRVERFSRLGRYLYSEGSEEAMELLAVVNERIIELDKAWNYLLDNLPEGTHDPRLDQSPAAPLLGGGAGPRHTRMPGLDRMEEWLFRGPYLIGHRR